MRNIRQEKSEVSHKCKFSCMVSSKGIFMTGCKNYIDTPTSLDKSLRESRGQLLNAQQYQSTFLPVEYVVIVIAAVTHSPAHRVITLEQT